MSIRLAPLRGVFKPTGCFLCVAAAGCVPAATPGTSAQAAREGAEVRVLLAPFSSTEAALVVEPGPGPHPSRMRWSHGRRQVEINDEGRDADAHAGDGVFTGITPFDAADFHNRRTQWRSRIRAHRDPKGAIFDGRTVQSSFVATERQLDAAVTAVHIPALGGTLTAFPLFPALNAGGQSASFAPTVDPRRTLVINDPSVVRNPAYTGVWVRATDDHCELTGDPDGPWGIRRLLSGIANGTMSADELGSAWIAENAVDRTVNGYTAPGGVQGVYDLHGGSPLGPPAVPWPKLWDDGNPMTFNDILDFSQAPLQLIAIVNRIDLAAGGYAGPREGELRFVFAFIHEETCEPMNGNIIFEYAVPSECGQIEALAHAWFDLDTHPLGSPSYLAALRDITDPIVQAGADPSRPNESALKVLRTNDQVFRWPHYTSHWPSNSGQAWFMEEWVIDPATHRFTNQLLAQQPGLDWELPDFAAGAPYPQDIDGWIMAHAPDIVGGTHEVTPLDPGGLRFQSVFAVYGGFSSFSFPYPQNGITAPYLPPMTWSGFRGTTWGSGNVTDIEARQRFSLATCAGCHFGETFEDGEGTGAFESIHAGLSTPGGVSEEPFRHVRADMDLSQPAHLSRFLTGTNASCTPGAEFVAPLGPLATCSSPSCCPIGDPVFGYDMGQYHYNEFLRRGAFLEDLVVSGCAALEGHRASPVVASAH